MQPTVALLRTSNQDLRKNLGNLMALSGCAQLFRPGLSVILKPNWVTDKPDYISLGANTSVEVLEALLAFLVDHRCKVSIGESETGTPAKGRRLALAWERMQIPPLAARYGAELLNLSEGPRRRIAFEGTGIPELELAEALFECDLLIDIPKIKTHKYAVLTCSMKNLYGLLAEPRRVIYHRWLSEIIARLSVEFQAKTLSVVDGLIGMEGNGPLYGKAVPLDLLLCGRNLWDVDRVVCDLIGIDPRKVPYLVQGVALGIGSWEREIEVVGDPLSDCRRKFQPVEFNLYRTFEKKLMESPLVHLVTSHWFQRHISSHFGGLTQRLRGGGYSWYLEKD